jgi:hypothetical protein
MGPAQKRLGRHHAAGCCLVLRLVGEGELIALEGVAKIGLERQAPDRCSIGAESMELGLVAALVLRLVHGGVGVGQERVGIGAVAREHADADRAGDEHVVAFEHERARQDVKHRLGDRARVAGPGQRRRQHGELVAAEPGDRAGVADRRAHPSRHFLEKLVATAVAQSVIDQLESVEVEQHHRERVTVMLGAFQGLAELALEPVAVRQPGQAVERRELVDVGGGPLALDGIMQRAGKNLDAIAILNDVVLGTADARLGGERLVILAQHQDRDIAGQGGRQLRHLGQRDGGLGAQIQQHGVVLARSGGCHALAELVGGPQDGAGRVAAGAQARFQEPPRRRRGAQQQHPQDAGERHCGVGRTRQGDRRLAWQRRHDPTVPPWHTGAVHGAHGPLCHFSPERLTIAEGFRKICRRF